MTSGGAVMCIGVFDGVHRGHRVLLAEGRRQADELGIPLIAVTFDPHPMAVVRPDAVPTALASVSHRCELLREAGADSVDILSFDRAMAGLEPEEFVDRELVERLGARAVVVGEDFRFGRGAAGTVSTLRMRGEAEGFTVTPVTLAGEGGERWSSTAVRGLVEAGDVVAAAATLGRSYSVDGTVVHGDHRGRELGYPTANLDWEYPATIPADGVYAGWLTGAGGAPLPSAISVGTNPQFDGRETRVEAYVLDRTDLDLYGRVVRLEFVERLRGQRRFDDVDALVEQMGRDVTEAAARLGIQRS